LKGKEKSGVVRIRKKLGCALIGGRKRAIPGRELTDFRTMQWGREEIKLFPLEDTGEVKADWNQENEDGGRHAQGKSLSMSSQPHASENFRGAQLGRRGARYEQD